MAKVTRIGLVIEQALGHLTHADNLRQLLGKDDLVAADWMMIPYQADDIWNKVPKLPFSVELSLRARRAVQNTLRHNSLDCLFFHTHNLTLFALGLMKTLPTVISLDATPMNFKSIAAAYDARVSGGVVGQVKSAWFQRAFLLASGLVTMSEWAKASLVQDYGIPNTKIRVFPPGVDVRQWQCYSGKPSSRKRLRLLFVGGDFERKGGYVLIEAFRRGLSDFCELDIVTSAQALQTGDGVRVHTGLTPNSTLLKKYFAEADLFVMPTMGDATPFAVLEAMASGLPVITTRTGGLGEMVQDGVTGVFVAPSDPNGIIDAVTSLAGHRALLEQMGRAGRADVERRFSAESNGKGLIAYLREVSMSMPGGLRARS